MDFVRQVLIYVCSAVLVPVARAARGIILLVLPMPLIGKRSGIVTQAVLSLLLNFSLVYLVALISGVLEVEPSLCMLIPAAFFTVLKSRTQRSRFRSGTSLEESLHKRIVSVQGGQPGSDYRQLLILREYVNEIAALVGLLAGGLLFLRLK
ncbi:MAG: hypothetical protein JSW47_07635 [Phycisphaerales bacterium]|nr:MAG: hypothetical protein JSW47_07635 [Phycisphaerales bacterium]